MKQTLFGPFDWTKTVIEEKKSVLWHKALIYKLHKMGFNPIISSNM